MKTESTVNKQKFIIAGLGNRGRDSFARALLAFPNRGIPEFRERAEIAAFVDINIERARVANQVLGAAIPAYTTIQEAAARHPADWARKMARNAHLEVYPQGGFPAIAVRRIDFRVLPTRESHSLYPRRQGQNNPFDNLRRSSICSAW